jgi:hypothetical protein
MRVRMAIVADAHQVLGLVIGVVAVDVMNLRRDCTASLAHAGGTGKGLLPDPLSLPTADTPRTLRDGGMQRSAALALIAVVDVASRT